MRKTTLYSLLLMIILISSCSPAESPTPAVSVPEVATEAVMSVQLTSAAFAHEGSIPAQYTCSGSDISPALNWGEPPAGTQSFALIMDDPDAPVGIWVHWVVFNIPASARGLAESLPPGETLPDGGVQGRNSNGNIGYNGPCPPSGTHRYFFKLYALGEMLGLSPGADKGELLKAMEGHILAEGELMGTYSR